MQCTQKGQSSSSQARHHSDNKQSQHAEEYEELYAEYSGTFGELWTSLSMPTNTPTCHEEGTCKEHLLLFETLLTSIHKQCMCPEVHLAAMQSKTERLL